MLDFSPQLKWSFIQDLDLRTSSCLLFQSWWAGICLSPEWRGLFHSPMELAVCDCLVTGWVCTSVHYVRSVLGQQNTWDLTCKDWVFNFKCNVYENQSEPCILLNIYFVIFFLPHELFQRRVLGSFQSHVEACSAVVSAATIPQSYPPLCPSPLTYSSFVSPVIFTYRFTLFGFQMCLF